MNQFAKEEKIFLLKPVGGEPELGVSAARDMTKRTCSSTSKSVIYASKWVLGLGGFGFILYLLLNQTPTAGGKTNSNTGDNKADPYLNTTSKVANVPAWNGCNPSLDSCISGYTWYF